MAQLALTIKINTKKMTEITENRVEATEEKHSTVSTAVSPKYSAGISHSVVVTIPQKGESRNRIWSNKVK